MNEVATIQTLNNIYPVAQLQELATAFVNCGFYGFKRKEEALVLMLKARADGVDPCTAADQYSIIQGRPSLKSEAILIRFQNAGGKIAWKKREDEECTLWLSHPAGGELTVTWNKDRATKAKLWNKDNFQKHPAQMLAARCVSEGVRAIYPACLSGCYTPEETIFFEDRSSDTAAAATEQPKAEKPKPKTAKKAENAVDAEVVEPETKASAEHEQSIANETTLDEKTAAFVDWMFKLRESNKAVFDQCWGKYVYLYDTDFKKVPVEQQRAVYTDMKQSIANIVAQNINDYMG